MRAGAEKPARSDPASRPGPQKFLGGAAKSRAQPGKTRASPSRLRCPAYKRKRLVGGGISSRAFSHQPPLLSPLAPPPAAAQDSGDRSRQEHAGRPPRARGLPIPPASAGRRICRSAALHRGPPDLAFSGRRLLPQAMEWSGSLSRSPGKGASPHAGAGSSARRRRRFAGMDFSGRPLGSVLTQHLCGLPMPLIQCDDCPRQVLRLTSGTPKHPGWV